jgi:hypothetical protein
MTLPGAPYAPAAGGVDPVDPPSARPGPLTAALDAALRVAGGVLSVVAALLTGLVEIGLSTVRVGGIPIGVSILLAVVGNVAVAWFAHRTVGTRWAVVLPWLPWTALMFLAAGVRTGEGDFLLSGDNWVALPMILLGSVAFGVYGYRLILATPPRR